ncbi:hypothetical protein ANN_22835 [Periplaneta americana]|uniref:Uncharacterized protein n=1 Tax=Periplaneta americana TaxID=6978 RepID=A0ABQ8SJS9_PERAM|nr:hypothetical protein ANN_22835 [Periplaneta americana]
MADLCEGGNEPAGSLKAICNEEETTLRAPRNLEMKYHCSSVKEKLTGDISHYAGNRVPDPPITATSAALNFVWSHAPSTIVLSKLTYEQKCDLKNQMTDSLAVNEGHNQKTDAYLRNDTRGESGSIGHRVVSDSAPLIVKVRIFLNTQH